MLAGYVEEDVSQGGWKGSVQFLQEFESAVKGFWSRSAAFIPSLLNALRFQGMEFWKLIVELDPLVPFHGTQAHGDMVGAIFEGSIRQGFCGVHVPAWVWGCCGTFEVDGCPYSGWSLRGSEFAGGWWGGLLEVGGWSAWRLRGFAGEDLGGDEIG